MSDLRLELKSNTHKLTGNMQQELKSKTFAF